LAHIETIADKADPDGQLTRLFDWWSENGRIFPWRQTVDPFKVLIAEILLQRSRSGSVAKVFGQLFSRWPGLRELANADLHAIEMMVNPLGLRGRARTIKEVAIAWLDAQDPPNSAEQLRKLPGVGPYMANATAAAMSWESDPCYDTVSIRVLRRFMGDTDRQHTDEEVASHVYSQVPRGHWRELNWAVLDLAASVCMPRTPRCEQCPLSDAGCEWARDRCC
jgi:A/G-specific adenine glycosylase